MRSGDFGTPMVARRTGLELPLPLQFLAAWLAVWLGRVLQEQVEYVNAENRQSANRTTITRGTTGNRESTDFGRGPCRQWRRWGTRRSRLGGLLNFYYREAA